MPRRRCKFCHLLPHCSGIHSTVAWKTWDRTELKMNINYGKIEDSVFQKNKFPEKTTAQSHLLAPSLAWGAGRGGEGGECEPSMSSECRWPGLWPLPLPHPQFPQLCPGLRRLAWSTARPMRPPLSLHCSAGPGTEVWAGSASTYRFSGNSFGLRFPACSVEKKKNEEARFSRGA